VSWLWALVGFAVGLAGASALAVVEWGAWSLVLPGRRGGAIAAHLAGGGDGGGVPIAAVAADGVRLAGVWHAADPPAQGGRVVLLIHGFAESPAGRSAGVDALRCRGWDVATLDGRAAGRSGGDRGSFGDREAGDVVAWIDAIAAEKPPAAGGRPVVALWGRSMGAATAVRAATLDRRVSALVLEAAYPDFSAVLVRVLKRRRLPAPGAFARLILRRAARLAGASLHRLRPLDLAPDVAVPTLLLHGDADTLVPIADARRLAAAFPCRAELIEVAGAGHNDVVDAGGDVVLGRVVGFLDLAAGGQDGRG